MPLERDLLLQARMLATIDSGIPLQANLRRAISASYYAFFHLLIAESVALLAPKQPAGLASRVARSFQHNEMRKICELLQKQVLPSELRTLFPNGLSTELRSVAEIFPYLQQLRHAADYDTSFVVTRDVVLSTIQDTENAFAAWDSIRTADEATVFLTALAFGARWSK